METGFLVLGGIRKWRAEKVGQVPAALAWILAFPELLPLYSRDDYGSRLGRAVFLTCLTKAWGGPGVGGLDLATVKVEGTGLHYLLLGVW